MTEEDQLTKKPQTLHEGGSQTSFEHSEYIQRSSTYNYSPTICCRPFL